MNNFQIQAFVRQIIAEAKAKKEDTKKDTKKPEAKKDTKKPEPKKAKKVSGNLVEMKEDLAKLKEKLSKLDDLIADWESLKSAANNISYSGEGDIEIGADKREDIMSDCDAEISKLKKEKEGIEKEIANLKESTSSEINKIKEMMGLVKKEGKKEKMVDEKKDELEEARFKKGTDIGKPGKGFEKIAKSAAKRYGSEEAGKRVAGAILKKVVKK